MKEFQALMKKPEEIDGAYVEVPFDVEAEFGAKRVKVKATFDGCLYRGSIVRMDGAYLLGIPKEIRNKIGKHPGDEIAVTVERDDEERKVELSLEFSARLQSDKQAFDYFSSLSYSHQREYALWVDGAKREETKQARMEKALALLRQGKNLR